MTDIRMTSGDSITFDVFVTRKDANGVDQPVNLTGAKAWFYCKKQKRDADVDALISLDTSADPLQIRFLAPATDGIIRVTLNPADTDGLASDYPYDIQVEESDGTVTTVESGFLQVARDITVTTA